MGPFALSAPRSVRIIILQPSSTAFEACSIIWSKAFSSAFKPLFDNRYKLSIDWNRQVWLPNNWELKILFKNELPDSKESCLRLIKSIISEFGMTCVYKGSNSVVLSSGNKVFENSTGNSGMAVTGMGDVLGGIVGAFIAQGMSILDAACWGVYVHGLAGDEAYSKLGNGLLARDLVDYLPIVIQKLNSKMGVNYENKFN